MAGPHNRREEVKTVAAQTEKKGETQWRPYVPRGTKRIGEV